MSKKEGCSCERCKECCRREPGWFIPDEIALAASYLNMDVPAFTARYLTEHTVDGTSALSPATKPKTTECIFLDNKGLCKIHPVKPYECRKVLGCGPASRHKRIREIIAKRWK